MSAEDLLHLVARRLDAADIPFMVTGSVAATAHGAGRATMDVDVVIDTDLAHLRHFVSSLSSPDLYVSMDAAVEALHGQSMFNIIDIRTGWKADLIVRKLRPFSETEFARRRSIDFGGRPMPVATMEDLVVAKLEWAKAGGSARQIDDVAALLRVAAGNWDRPYVEHWATALGLHEQWKAAQLALDETTPRERA